MLVLVAEGVEPSVRPSLVESAPADAIELSIASRQRCCEVGPSSSSLLSATSEHAVVLEPPPCVIARVVVIVVVVEFAVVVCCGVVSGFECMERSGVGGPIHLVGVDTSSLVLVGVVAVVFVMLVEGSDIVTGGPSHLVMVDSYKISCIIQ